MKLSSFLSLAGISGTYARSLGQIIETSSGPVRGHAAAGEPSVSAFLGIPYAHPPVGHRRFMPPEEYHGHELIDASDVVSHSIS